MLFRHPIRFPACAKALKAAGAARYDANMDQHDRFVCTDEWPAGKCQGKDLLTREWAVHILGEEIEHIAF